MRGHFKDQYTLGPILSTCSLSELRICWTVEEELEYNVKILRKDALQESEVALFEAELLVIKGIRSPYII